MLWLWCRLAAVAAIGLLAWEPPYAVSAALKSKEKKKKRKKKILRKTFQTIKRGEEGAVCSRCSK